MFDSPGLRIQLCHFEINWPLVRFQSNSTLMWLACQKKSFFICDEITNSRICTQPIPIFFLKYKTETAKQGRDSCLTKNEYYIIFRNS